MTHVYNNKGIRRAIEAGVKSIEHANLADEDTMKLMKETGTWLSPQVTVYTYIPNGYNEDQVNKHRAAYAGLDNIFTIAKKIGYNQIVCGTDIICDLERIKTLAMELVNRTKWFTPFEILRQATANAGELIGLSHRFSPGKIGVIEEGAMADILLVDGNPLDDVKIMTSRDNLACIMKGGKIFKNTA
jgi:imidazolonepropionase-like amidohydrolase